MRTVLVTGGTGNLGRHVVSRLADTDTKVRVLTRKPVDASVPGGVQGDLRTGEGLAHAVAGVDTIVHCATHPKHRTVDIPGTERLLELAREHDVAHFAYISIVGVDQNPFNY